MLSFRLFGVRVVVTIWFAALFALLFMYDARLTTSCFIFMAAHELGHIIPYLCFGGRISAVELLLGRIEIKRRGGAINENAELLSLLGGSLINLIFAASFYLLKIEKLAAINFALALFNLLPVYSLDGGEIVKNISERFLSSWAVERLRRTLSFVFGLGIMSFGFYAIIGFRNPTIIIFGFYILFATFANN